ncbi:hypothetical protein CDAR_590691 [Caerostris darwini]|uniref:Uncharacterized protein n=1 Tax=Caerostris darwini TaxID=1538125 RepID=A0AAV4N542_9ARAC|nr:hypothetical protein CDAR_590691 [Caerostris darwini]
MFPIAVIVFFCYRRLLFEGLCYHCLSLLPSSNTASWDFLCCQRFQLLSSSSSATVVLYSRDFYYHRLSLLLSSTTASCDFLCCHHLPLLRVTFSAAIIYHCFGRIPLLSSSNTASCDFLCCQRFQLLSSSSSVNRHLLLPPSSFTVAVICYHRAISFTAVVFLCCRPHDDFRRNNFCHL